MELEKKTTILFPPHLHAHLVRLARQRGVSLGLLVRQACESAYGPVAVEERIQAVERVTAMELRLPPWDVLEGEIIAERGAFGDAVS